MSIPLRQQITIAKYLLKQKLFGKEKFPLCLMLEPLYKCNLACQGCGKIAQPYHVLNMRMSVADALKAVDEANTPIVSIPGGEPLIHKEMASIVQGIIHRKKYVYLCTNALLLRRRIDEYTPSEYFTWSIHLDGPEDIHDRSVDQVGGYKIAYEAIKMAVKRGFRVSVNTTIFVDSIENAEKFADFFDDVTTLGVEGITISPGFQYQDAPGQNIFLGKEQIKEFFKVLFAIKKKRKAKWPINHSNLYLRFLQGHEEYSCTPWGNPTYSVLGWNKGCYLWNEGYTDSFEKMMNETDWQKFGNHKNCENCMAHVGFECSAVNDVFSHPIKLFRKV
ncbi:MAG: adenosyl-hopene transferase HpnH [Candidatus Nitrosotenuis sp.]